MAEAKVLGVLGFQQRIKGGVRPNLFQVSHKFPTGAKPQGGETSEDEYVAYMCKSAALPQSSVGTVELPFRGRVIKVPGDRTFESWTATFYMDDAFSLRAAYEKWIDLTNSVDANTASAPISEILSNITVTQLDKFEGSADEFKAIRSYELFKAFPVSVSQVSLAYDNNDSYEEFDVEFAYQFFETNQKSGGGGNELKAVKGTT